MTLACPHCSQLLEFTPEVLASLHGHSECACPHCGGMMAVPQAGSKPVSRLPNAPIAAKAAAQAQRSMNRNLLVLGVVTLVVIGGIGALLAVKGGGNVFNTFQNITQQIIHNSYFTQLIANGTTSEKDLEAIAEIRPYGESFIGVSKEALEWPQAKELAQKCGAWPAILPGDEAEQKKLLQWLSENLDGVSDDTLWMQSAWEARLLRSGKNVESPRTAEGRHRLLMSWMPREPSQENKQAKYASQPSAATLSQPFVNSLGMRFVPVPSTSTLFCVHETRRVDYAEYEKTKNKELPDANAHPFAPISWQDASSFCYWLCQKEGIHYRLPTDWEWSASVGIAHLEKESDLPEQRRWKVKDHYPWGTQWPPPSVVGNYGDVSCKKPFPGDLVPIHYNDGHPTTAPVMSFPPNEHGLFDLGGNVQEWCQDFWNTDKTRHPLRGSSWLHQARVGLVSSYRAHDVPQSKHADFGFRIVIDLSGDPGDPPGKVKKVTDLLPLTDPTRDSLGSSVWTKTDDGLHLAAGGEGHDGQRLQLPHAVTAEEYDFEIEFTSEDEEPIHINQFLPMQGKHLVWTINLFKDHAKPYTGFPDLDGIPAAKAKEAHVWAKDLLRPGVRHRSVVKVRKDSLTGILDGKVIVYWKGDMGRFKLRSSSPARDPRFPLIRVSKEGDILHQATVTEFITAKP